VNSQWGELERLLGAILAEIGAKLPPDQLMLVEDFVDNREFGVAYDWLASVLEGAGLTVSREIAERLNRVAALMGVVPHSVAVAGQTAKPSKA
jgi:hypothetical protein